MGNSFNERAATWDDNPRRIKLVDEVASLLNQKINFDKICRIVDYGCGTGLLGYKFIDSANEVLFCDTSEGMLEQVKRKQQFYGYTNVKTLLTDFSTDELPGGNADLIFSMLVLHHVADLKTLVEKFACFLNTGGLFCWIDLDKEDGSFHGFDNTIPHNGFSKVEIEQLLGGIFDVTFYSTELKMLKEIDGEFKEYALFVLIAQKI